MFLDVNVGHLTELLTGRTVHRREIAFRVAERVRQYRDEGLTRGDRVIVWNVDRGRTEFFATAMELSKLSEYWDRALNFVWLLVLVFSTHEHLIIDL